MSCGSSRIRWSPNRIRTRPPLPGKRTFPRSTPNRCSDDRENRNPCLQNKNTLYHKRKQGTEKPSWPAAWLATLNDLEVSETERNQLVIQLLNKHAFNYIFWTLYQEQNWQQELSSLVDLRCNDVRINNSSLAQRCCCCCEACWRLSEKTTLFFSKTNSSFVSTSQIFFSRLSSCWPAADGGK